MLIQSPADHRSLEKPSWLEKSNVNILQKFLILHLKYERVTGLEHQENANRNVIFLGGTIPLIKHTHTQLHYKSAKQLEGLTT